MPKCSSTIVFGDDHGDNVCTMHCQLEEGHAGLCMETGDINGQRYTVIWERLSTSSEPTAPIERESAELENAE